MTSVLIFLIVLIWTYFFLAPWLYLTALEKVKFGRYVVKAKMFDGSEHIFTPKNNSAFQLYVVLRRAYFMVDSDDDFTLEKVKVDYKDYESKVFRSRFK